MSVIFAEVCLHSGAEFRSSFGFNLLLACAIMVLSNWTVVANAQAYVVLGGPQ
jgi:hypothetical protein